jgi:hypothetical protein
MPERQDVPAFYDDSASHNTNQYYDSMHVQLSDLDERNQVIIKWCNASDADSRKNKPASSTLRPNHLWLLNTVTRVQPSQ